MPETAAQLIQIITRVEAEARALGLDIRGTQPSPGNIRGGLTTIEEKSLGATHKGGERARLEDVVGYAAPIRQKGLTVMDTPGLDVESVTGMVGGGAQVVVFTTGLGTPTGNPIAPVIKITGNARTARQMADNLDLEVSGVMSDTETLDPRRTGCSTKSWRSRPGRKQRPNGSAIANSRFTGATRRSEPRRCADEQRGRPRAELPWLMCPRVKLRRRAFGRGTAARRPVPLGHLRAAVLRRDDQLRRSPGDRHPEADAAGRVRLVARSTTATSCSRFSSPTASAC